MLTSTECERSEACPNSTGVLQSVLGADKRNAVFTVYRAQNGPAPCLHVYYGAELLEVVPEDRRHPAFKLLLGRLYNTGIKAVTLQQSFGVDRKTMQRWGGALRCADPQQLVRALAGRGGPRKLTPEIRAFVTMRFPQLYGQSRAGYSQRVRAEIKGVFGVRLSGECLRPHFQQLKAELRREMGPPAACPPAEKRATACVYPPEPPLAVTALSVPGAALGPPVAPIRNQSPVLPAPDPAGCTGRFCRHLGVLLFSTVLLDLEKHLAAPGWLLKQWLTTLLLGAVNIEQTKLLDFDDLQRLLGRTLRSLFPQRSQLTELASNATVPALLSFNARLVGAAQGRDFYFDPHTKHYTGGQNVLKGWCARIRSCRQSPAFGFLSHRRRRAGLSGMRGQLSGHARALYRAAAALSPAAGPARRRGDHLRDRPGHFQPRSLRPRDRGAQLSPRHLGKNYRPGQWNPQQRSGECVLERARNHAADKRLYRFEYIDRNWAKNPAMRQLIVRATNPRGRTVELGILTDDRPRPAAAIIVLMFNRWIQENDFKYLDQHFGINQITSYASVAYERLKDQLEARQMKSGAYNNYRDDHALFRNLTQADGVLVETAEHVEAHLLPTVNYPPKLEKILQELLAKFNATAPLMPDGSGRALRLRLAEKSGLQVAIDP